MEEVTRGLFQEGAGKRWRCSGTRGVTLWIAILLLLRPSLRAADPPLEYQVKAAYLLNFTKFIEWPGTAFRSAAAPISICILGEDPFGSVLDQILEGERVNGRRVVAQRIKRAPAPRTCQILFIGQRGPEVARLLPGLGPGVLTVGEGAGFLSKAGMIAFVVEQRRVRFDINQSAAESAGLKLSSKLMGVARLVER